MKKRIWCLCLAALLLTLFPPGSRAERQEKPMLIPALPYMDEADREDGAALPGEEDGPVLLDAPITAEGFCGSGEDGKNLSWTLDARGILTIRGEGAMAGFGYDTSESTAPWNEYENQIHSVVIEEGVTSVGDIAFVYYTLDNLLLPSTLSSVGWAAFYYAYVEHVYYAGPADQWAQISMGNYNTALDSPVMNSSAALCVVTYEPNGGGGTMPHTVRPAGQPLTLPECAFASPAAEKPTEYQQFLAWEVDGTQYPAGASCSIQADTTVTALWETRKLNSGDLSAPKLDREQIAQLLKDNSLALPGELFDETPSVKAPYAPGKVKTAVLQLAANRLTALRAIAGLPAVELDAALCESAQYGAVLLAASEFSHTPAQPSDMDDAFYQMGYSATSSSNIASGYSLTGCVDGFMDDSDAGNVARVGHRSWQLTPKLKKIGFGYAVGRTAEKVFDSSGEDVEYRFISWPASGYFPNSLFAAHTAWSLRLNSQFYKARSEGISVTLRRTGDGAAWTFTEGQEYTPGNSGTYFNRSGDLIIFRPDGINTYEGQYTVSVEGLLDSAGSPAAFAYEVEFFDAQNLETDTPPAVNQVSRTGGTVTAQVVCGDTGAEVFCAVYNAAGQMLAVDSRSVTGPDSVQFQFESNSIARAKVFLLDKNLSPLCAAKDE